ncbi:MAG TPA: dicarboxylate/amino acid:cation symporter [Gemmatimonadaceae bacterium]|nr:dicarboxylate/amino acid:cation symporter [Gemmatimonadaceae bacterium]
MSLTTRVLLALAAGLLGGLALSAANPAIAQPIVAVIEPVGTIFINAIRMTVIPLVVASLIVGVGTSTSGRSVARIGGRGLLVFLALLALSGVAGALLAPPVFAHVTLDPAALAELRAHSPGGIAAGASAMQTPSQWFVALVPANVMRAAADGAMLPLIVFSLVLGLALVSVSADARAPLVTWFRAITACMLVIVRWLLVVAPIGVFALALPLVARLGASAIGALAVYVVLVSAVAVLVTILLYPIAAWGGRISMRSFARAAAPAQGIAFSSRSSIAALPALIEEAQSTLHLSDETTGFFIPLASAMFRIGATMGLTIGAAFIARLYGVTLGGSQLVTLVLTSLATSFSIPGIPGGSIIAMVPVLAAVGLPMEGLGILLGVDTIPDIFRTTANVTGQLAAAVIVDRPDQ